MLHAAVDALPEMEAVDNWIDPPIQIVPGLPASTVTGVYRVTITSSEVPVHKPPVSLMVHKNLLTPKDKPDTVVVGELGSVKLPVPAVTVHVPCSAEFAAFPASVVLEEQTS
jgi:hypothetical protein